MFFFKSRSVARATLAALVLSSVTSIPSVASAGLSKLLCPRSIRRGSLVGSLRRL